ALITGALYAYYVRRTVPFFLLIGVAVWVRPDALVFLLAALVHIAYTHGIARNVERRMDEDTVRESKRSLRNGMIIFVALFAGYVLFNMVLSGSIFPSSVGAKIMFYGLTESNFWYELARFYTVGPSIVLTAFAIIGLSFAGRKFIRRESMPIVFPIAYIVGTILAYWLIHPYLYESQRYLVPTVPFFLLLSAWGIREIFDKVAGSFGIDGLRRMGRIVLFIIFGGAIVVGIAGFTQMRDAHFTAVRYINERGVKAAEWLERNTSQNVLIGTHLPGVTGWFADREVMDFTGVVSPELIPSIGNLTDLTAALLARNASYLLTDRDQFEVVNVNPVFHTNILRPGITEVCRFVQGRTVIV
ncbi:MAG: hypothetical protein IH628_01690, partial [Proteobacteria bacterium]|nr:hypothetical protein [Pseudomonadota bacterium]